MKASIKTYIDYLKSLTEMVADSIRRHEKFLYRVEAALGKPILEVERGSEINEAIYRVVANRKIAFNGGQVDPTGADLKFRLGKSVTYFVTWAHSENFIPRNFYPKNSFQKPHMTEAYYLTEEKIWFLYKYKGFDLKTQAIIRFLIDTGVRVSELCSVKLTDIDFESRILKIYMSKVRRYKEAPMMQDTVFTLKQMLAAREVESEYLFCVERNGDGRQKRGSAMSTGSIRRRLNKWGDKFGFRINPHSFRHGIGTIWYKRHGLLPTAKLLGHIDMKYTAHYAHILGSDLKKLQKDLLPAALESVGASPN